MRREGRWVFCDSRALNARPALPPAGPGSLRQVSSGASGKAMSLGEALKLKERISSLETETAASTAKATEHCLLTLTDKV